MTNIRSFIVGLAVLVLLLLGGVYVYQKSIKQTLITQKTESSPLPDSKFKAISSPLPTSAVQTEPKTNITIAPATGDDPQNVGIYLANPKPLNKITSPLQIDGSANVEDAIVNLVVLDANRMVLGSTKITTCMATNACPFQANVNFIKSTTPTGIIEVYSTATDINPQPNLQTINISF